MTYQSEKINIGRQSSFQNKIKTKQNFAPVLVVGMALKQTFTKKIFFFHIILIVNHPPQNFEEGESSLELGGEPDRWQTI